MSPSSVRKGPAQLERCAGELRLVIEDVRKLLIGSGEQELRRKPSSTKWSALECIAHLNIVNAAMLPGIRQTVESASPVSNANRSYRMDLQGWLFVWAFEPRRFIKLKTSPSAQPVNYGSPRETLAEFERTHEELISLLRDSSGKEIDRRKTSFPFDANVKYTVYAAFRIIAAHDRRHALQAWKALKRPQSL